MAHEEPTLAMLAGELRALREELIDAVEPIEQRVVELAGALDRLEHATAVPPALPAMRPPAGIDRAAEAGAGAALIAAAATAVARIESRLDATFDGIQRELAEMRLLLAQRADVAPVLAAAPRRRGLLPRRRTT